MTSLNGSFKLLSSAVLCGWWVGGKMPANISRWRKVMSSSRSRPLIIASLIVFVWRVLLLQPIFDVRHLPSILSSICQTLGSLWPHNARGVRSQQHVSLPGGLGARITSTMTIRSIRGVERYYWRFLLSKSQEPFVPRITPTTSPLIKPYLGGEYPTERGVPYWVGSILLSVLKHLTLLVSFQA